MQFSGSGSKDSLSSLYVLKHKDLDVAMVQIDNMTGSIEYILDIYIPEELPLGCDANGGGVKEWWKARAIPESRKGIRQVLNSLNEKNQSVSDAVCLWIEPDRPLLAAAGRPGILLERSELL